MKNAINTILNLILLAIMTLSATSLEKPDKFPTFKIIDNGGASPGQLLGGIQIKSDTIGSFNYLVNTDGEPLYYENANGSFFSMQASGQIVYPRLADKNNHIYMILDNQFKLIDSVQMKNNYFADSHDFQILPNGHFLMLSYVSIPADMSKYSPNGRPDALALGNVIQELDQERNVIFQWRSWDYLNYTDTYADYSTRVFDPVHINSIEMDWDGNLLISCRHTCDIIKVSRQTGDIIWRLGGIQNQFEFINEREENAPLYFKYQHDARILPNGNLMLFDNGITAQDMERGYARVVEYKIDESNKTAELVWDFRHNHDIIADNTGRMFKYDNGNYGIWWGGAVNRGEPVFTEVSPDGKIVYEISLYLRGLRAYFEKVQWDIEENTIFEEKRDIVLDKPIEFAYNNQKLSATLTLSELESDEMPFIKMSENNFAPMYPRFEGSSPRVLAKRYIIGTSGIGKFIAKFTINADLIKYRFPEKITVFYRNSNGSGVFLPLPTTFDVESNQIIVDINDSGEYILTFPDVVQQAFPPKPDMPPNGKKVVAGLPVMISWAPKGISKHFQLQIDDNPEFASPISIDGLTQAFHRFDETQEFVKYYWRVRTTNDGGTSQWSEVYSFETGKPFLNLSFPNGGEKIARDRIEFIKWETNMPDKIIAEIYRDGMYVTRLDTAISPGVVAWNIPRNFPKGSGYIVKLSCFPSVGIKDSSEASFEIIDSIDVSVAQDSEIEKAMTATPNPSSGKIILSVPNNFGNSEDFSVFSILGEKLFSFNHSGVSLNGESIEADLSSLNPGFYIIKRHTTGQCCIVMLQP